jgi:hypothetical protein
MFHGLRILMIAPQTSSADIAAAVAGTFTTSFFLAII